MNSPVIALMGTGPLGLWTAAALAGDDTLQHLHIRMGNTRGQAPAWVPPAVQAAFEQGRLSWHAFDAMEAASVLTFTQGASAIVHSAIPDYHEWLSKLPVIQRNAIDAALAHKARLICADNLYAYAAPVNGPLTEAQAEIPPSRKGQLRKDMLDLMRRAQREHSLVWITVQGSQYFGPGAGGQSVFGDWFIGPVLANKPVRFVGNPSLPHAWAYGPDFGRAMALLAVTARSELLNRPWILPHATHLPAFELARLLFAELERQGMLPANALRKAVAVPALVLKVLGWFNPVIKAREEMLYQFNMPWEASGAHFSSLTGLVATPLPIVIEQTVAFWQATKVKTAL
ncbi:MAG: hypothetical protein AAAB16_22650 [Pseudomonas sp.]|uniref:hypothetical protein n=1 Tax=Pseudomonas sp. TaxID=306 RepID=UPI0030F14618